MADKFDGIAWRAFAWMKNVFFVQMRSFLHVELCPVAPNCPDERSRVGVGEIKFLFR
ncbi:hypothetical protein ACYX7E_03020 [Luteimonas sp. RIT-PG2_3]|jgi:hypothetical protein